MAVERIEEVDLEPEVKSFCDVSVLDERYIQVVVAGSVDGRYRLAEPV